MLTVSIPVRDYKEANQHVYQLARRADLIELRLDYAQRWELKDVNALKQLSEVPVIFTLRCQKQGGHYPHSESERLHTIAELCTLNPDYLDLEYDVSQEYIRMIRQRYPAIKIILSYHNFNETPADLSALFGTFEHTACYAYKIATQAHSTLDALRMLQWIQRVSTKHRVIGLCMGELGQCTRILAPVVGSFLSYAYWNPAQSTALGQLSLHDLTEIYRYRKLNTQTKIYAVLGDPVHLSVGHIVHNRAMALLERNAVYVKLRVSQAELPAAMDLVRQLPIEGLSVTMPLKETILPLLDCLSTNAQAIQAVNTVVKQSKWIGCNTDGLGAIQAVSEYGALNTHCIVIFGAGGAARAIAYTALTQGARVIILNRTLSKAKSLADELGCEAYALAVFPALKSYTMCINTLPERAFEDPVLQAIWQTQHILPEIVAMDIVYQPIETQFLKIAKMAHCHCIPGFHMYIGQALLQIQHWFAPEEEKVKAIATIFQDFFELSLDSTYGNTPTLR